MFSIFEQLQEPDRLIDPEQEAEGLDFETVSEQILAGFETAIPEDQRPLPSNDLTILLTDQTEALCPSSSIMHRVVEPVPGLSLLYIPKINTLVFYFEIQRTVTGNYPTIPPSLVLRILKENVFCGEDSFPGASFSISLVSLSATDRIEGSKIFHIGGKDITLTSKWSKICKDHQYTHLEQNQFCSTQIGSSIHEFVYHETEGTELENNVSSCLSLEIRKVSGDKEVPVVLKMLIPGIEKYLQLTDPVDSSFFLSYS